MGVVELLRQNNEQAIFHFRQCYESSIDMKNIRLQLDCLLCMGYIAYNSQDWEGTKTNFNQAYFLAEKIGEQEIAESCLCNAGIAAGNLAISQ
jgi:hypothetical protein